MKAVLDTNVVVSALLHEGTTRRFRELWESSAIQPLVSQAMLDEYVRVLYYPKFGFEPEIVAGIIRANLLPWIHKVEEAKGRLSAPSKDAADESFLRAALAGRAEVLVSGDPHLTILDGKYPFPIMKPGAFLGRYFPSREHRII